MGGNISFQRNFHSPSSLSAFSLSDQCGVSREKRIIMIITARTLHPLCTGIPKGGDDR